MITFLLLWTIAVIVFLLNPKSRVQRWFSAAAFINGLYGFHFTILGKIEILFNNYPVILFIETLLTYGFSYYLFPYVILMATIYYYTDMFGEMNKWHKPLSFILLLPGIIMYGIVIFWFKDFNHPRLILIRDLWVVPYLVAANFLLIKSCFHARTQRQKNDAMFTCIIITPILIADLILGYILRWFGVTIYVGSYLIIILFLSFSCILTRYGLLGRKIQIEKLNLDSSIKTMTSGAAILNHFIKNEIAKISICASNLSNVDLKAAPAKESVQIILSCVDHILEMLERTSQCTQDFIIEKNLINLKVFLEDILGEFRFQFQEKKIKLTTIFPQEVWIVADTLHLREVFNNIIKNAIEAMESGGKIDLNVIAKRRTVTIIIKDTGIGIPGDLLPNIFEPFFTTKNSKRNFGLGLLYCYKVLKKHGGAIEIDSKPTQVTTLYLSLPRYIKKRFFLAKGVSNVKDKNIVG